MDYFSRRASQERRAARSACDARARRCHEQLANLHSAARQSGEAASLDWDDEPAGQMPHFLILH
jgi:hypothetical protein